MEAEKAAEKESQDWKQFLADVAEYLLAQGHTQALSYVLKQAVTFYYIAHRRVRREQSEEVGMLRIAHHADQKQFSKYAKSLE